MNCVNHGGSGRGRTGDLTIFSRALVPTELPSHVSFLASKTNKTFIAFAISSDPDGT